MTIINLPKLLTDKEKEDWKNIFRRCSQPALAVAHHEVCIYFFDIFADYSQTHLFADVEAFLNEAVQDPELPMAYGFALYFYFVCQDWDKFYPTFAKVIELFPKFKFWQDLFTVAVFADLDFAAEDEVKTQ